MPKIEKFDIACLLILTTIAISAVSLFVMDYPKTPPEKYAEGMITGDSTTSIEIWGSESYLLIKQEVTISPDKDVAVNFNNIVLNSSAGSASFKAVNAFMVLPVSAGDTVTAVIHFNVPIGFGEWYLTYNGIRIAAAA